MVVMGKNKKAEMKKWDLLALIFGYNELAKSSQTLGEKVYMRLARDAAEKQYRELGGELDRKAEDEVIVVLREAMPRVVFMKQDINLMREAIREYDESNG
jgi:hypothetical protein